MIDSTRISDKVACAHTPVGEGIIEAHFHIGMGIYQLQHVILACCIQIIQQYSDAHPLVRRMQQLVVHGVTRQISMPDIILRIDGLFRSLDDSQPSSERIDTIVHNIKT